MREQKVENEYLYLLMKGLRVLFLAVAVGLLCTVLLSSASAGKRALAVFIIIITAGGIAVAILPPLRSRLAVEFLEERASSQEETLQEETRSPSPQIHPSPLDTTRGQSPASSTSAFTLASIRMDYAPQSPAQENLAMLAILGIDLPIFSPTPLPTLTRT